MQTFKTKHLVIIALISALGIAVKVVVGTLIRLVTGLIGVPGGAIAGGFYMLFMPIAMGITRVRGSCILVSFIQSLVIFATGVPGSHGIMTFITYMMPGVVCELVFLINPKGKEYNIFHFTFATMFANVVGTLSTSILFFKMPMLALILAMSSAALFGGLGGVLAYYIVQRINSSTKTNERTNSAEKVLLKGHPDNVVKNDEDKKDEKSEI